MDHIISDTQLHYYVRQRCYNYFRKSMYGKIRNYNEYVTEENILWYLQQLYDSYLDWIDDELVNTLKYLNQGNTMYLPDSKETKLRNFVGEYTFVPEVVTISIHGKLLLWVARTKRPEVYLDILDLHT